MRKSILQIFLLLSLTASAQNDLIIEQRWSQPDTLPFFVMEGLYFDEVDSKLYSEFEILQDESVFYPDIERSSSHAKFIEINDRLNLEVVTDTNLVDELFLKTDFRTEWSPLINVERGYNSTKSEDENWRHRWIVNASYQGQQFVDSIFYQSSPNRWYGVRSSLVSDESGLNAVFIGHSCIENVFAKVYFIHLNPTSKKFDIVEKEVTYEDLGYNASSIVAVTNYSNEFKINNSPGILTCFNIDNSSAIGISTIVFDLNKNEFKINSKKIDNSFLDIITEFNEVNVDIQSTDNSINFFINQYRCKISQGNESNTALDSESSKDILYLKYENGNLSQAQNFKEVRKSHHLQKKLKINDDFIFIYDKEPEDTQFDEKKHIGSDSALKLWLVHCSENRKILYEVGFEYSNLDPSIFENYLSFIELNDSSIDIIVYLSGDMFEPTKEYLIGKINITAPKRH